MEATRLLGLLCLWLYELTLWTVVHMWHTTGVGGELEVAASKEQLDLQRVRKQELQVEEVLHLV